MYMLTTAASGHRITISAYDRVVGEVMKDMKWEGEGGREKREGVTV